MPRGKSRRVVGHDDHTLVWDEFMDKNTGGYEVYRLLSETAVKTPGVSACVAATLRTLNRMFKSTVDPTIVSHMPTLNETIGSLHSHIRWHISHHNVCPQRPRTSPNLPPVDEEVLATWNAWKDEDVRLTEIVNNHTATIEAKFGFHTTMTLKKCISEHVNSLKGNGVLGWCPKSTDVAKLSPTIHGFLAAAGKQTCQLHAGRKQCVCSATIGGVFSFVPNGRGLVMHCDQSCIHEHSILLNASSGTPIVPRSRRDYQNDRSRELAQSMMLQVAIQPPFARDCMIQRAGVDAWHTIVHNIHTQLSGNRSVESPSVRLLLTDLPSVVPASASEPRIPSFQSLMKFDRRHVNSAMQHLEEADLLEKNIESARIELLRKHGESQINRILSEMGVGEGLVDITIVEAENLIPGCKKLIDSAVIDTIAKTPADRLRFAHVLSCPFTAKLVSIIVMALGQLKRYDLTFSGNTASGFAYSYVTGLCAGCDATFDVVELSAQLNCDVLQAGVSIQCWRDLVTTMHVFDAIDYQSIRVIECPANEVESYVRDYYGGERRSSTLFKWSFDIGGKRISGPVNCSTNARWHANKKESGEVLLVSHGYHPELEDLPTRKFLAILGNDPGFECNHGEGRKAAVKALCHWYEHTAQHLCARPETRAIGLDVLTGDNTRLLIKAVSDADLDSETVAAAAASMKIDEMNEE